LLVLIPSILIEALYLPVFSLLIPIYPDVLLFEILLYELTLLLTTLKFYFLQSDLSPDI